MSDCPNQSTKQSDATLILIVIIYLLYLAAHVSSVLVSKTRRESSPKPCQLNAIQELFRTKKENITSI